MALSVYLFAKKDYLSKHGTWPLYLGVLVNGKPKSPIPLKLKVKPAHWDDESEIPTVLKADPDARDKNTKLVAALSKGQKIIQRYEVLERALTYERFLKEWGGFNPYDFDQFVQEYIRRLRSAKTVKDNKPMFSEAYILKVGFVMGKFLRWRPGVDIHDIDYAMLKEYEAHLASIGNKTATIYSNLRIFRRVMDDAYNQELINRNPFALMRLRKGKVKKVPLEMDEVKKYEQLINFNLPYYLHKTLCWFLLAVYTGRRYGDIERFAEWEFKDDYIRLVQDKAIAGIQERKVIMIFMNQRIRDVIAIIRNKKYEPLTNSKANKFLKELTSMTGIDKTVTFHIARHSFNNINRKLGTDPLVRRELLGHDSFRSTQEYETPDPEQMKESMQRWNGA